MLRSLRARLLASFVALAIVVLVAVGGALFVVLRGLHADATTASLDALAGSVIPQVRQAIGSGDLRGAILDVRDTLAAEGYDVMIVGADGRLRPIAGLPVGDPILSTDLAAGATQPGRVVLDGKPYLYVAAGVRRVAAAAPKALAFLTPDRSAAEALGDLGRAIPAVVLVTLLISTPLAWLLARTVTRPLRRLAAAAAALPAGGRASSPAVGQAPLPLDGPTEVRDLTGTFNAMADELDETRRREAELLANLRHDLRTPLTVISGFATALRDGTASGEAAASAARAIEEEAGRLERLVDELGDIERLRDAGAAATGLRPERLDALAVIGATVERFVDRAERDGVTLVADAPPAGFDPAFTADPLAVERMLGNLVENALAATPSGGTVRIEQRTTTIGPRPAIEIDIVDDGPGFPPGQAERAFERFWRAEASRAGGGTGLGLAIVRELARAHGGEAEAGNVRPHGARVRVVLPRGGPPGER
ncbi:MAG TPA: HAMP domain-containing sensor histidine kinase [Candidatus Limnocylindrales bacterium]|nr:HAMP domain-containing sensor histidine kinase [Candidatus Limnocylindrales bacterium]